MSEPDIAGGTPREEPADGPPRKKARSGEAAVDRTEAAGAIKSVREAEAIDDVDVNEGTSIGRRRPTTPVPPPRSARIVGGSEPKIAGGTPREEPADCTPRKKARSGEAAVDRTEAAGAIKGVREAEAIDDVDVDEATSVGRRRPTTLVPITQADVDDNKATNGGRRRPTTVTDARKKARSGEAAVDRSGRGHQGRSRGRSHRRRRRRRGHERRASSSDHSRAHNTGRRRRRQGHERRAPPSHDHHRRSQEGEERRGGRRPQRPGPSRAFARPKPSTTSTSTSTRPRASGVVVRPLSCP